MNYDISVKLSENRGFSREGFFVIRNCALATVGAREYRIDEMPEVKPGAGETITVTRTAEELFNTETIASFESKPLTFLHPDSSVVTPANWKDVSIGHVRNVRRGEGENAGALVADLVINDAEAISAVIDDEVREISLGFTSHVSDVGGGIGVESRIRGNHVALVPKGRCGAFCALADAVKYTKEKAMSFFKKDNDPAPTGNDEMLKAFAEQLKSLSDAVGALKKEIDDLKAAKTADPAEPVEPQTDADKDPPKSEPQDPAKQEPKALTREDVKAMLDELLAKRDEDTSKNDAAVIKDAATVAPELKAETPNLAMAALAEYAKTAHGAKVLEEFGGLEGIKNDAAPALLHSVAITERIRADAASAQGNPSGDANDKPAPSFFEQAKKLWVRE